MYLQGGLRSTAARYISFHAAHKLPLSPPRYCANSSRMSLVQIGTAEATCTADDYYVYCLSRTYDPRLFYAFEPLSRT
jgi:hypothetical protein